MSDERVRVTVDAQGIAEVAMVRAGKMNSLDIAMFDALLAAIERLRHEPMLRVVVLHGEGAAFCAGLDMGLFPDMASGKLVGPLADLVPRTHGMANSPQQVAWGWRELPVPVIASVHGVAYGGGLQIALGADVRCVHPDAKLSVMEIKWGIVPDMAGCVLLTADPHRYRPGADIHRPYRQRPRGAAARAGDANLRGSAGRGARHRAADCRLQSRCSARCQASAQRCVAGQRRGGAAGRVVRTGRLIGSANQVEAVTAAMEKRAPVFR